MVWLWWGWYKGDGSGRWGGNSRVGCSTHTAAGELWVLQGGRPLGAHPVPAPCGGSAALPRGIPLTFSIPSAAPPPLHSKPEQWAEIPRDTAGREGWQCWGMGSAGGSCCSLSLQGEKPRWNSRSVFLSVEDQSQQSFSHPWEKPWKGSVFPAGNSQLCPSAQRGSVPQQEGIEQPWIHHTPIAWRLF